MDDVYKMLEEDRMLAQQKHDELEVYHTPRHSVHVSPALTLPVIDSEYSSAAALPRVEPLQPAVLLYPENSQLHTRTEVLLLLVCCYYFQQTVNMFQSFKNLQKNLKVPVSTILKCSQSAPNRVTSKYSTMAEIC